MNNPNNIYDIVHNEHLELFKTFDKNEKKELRVLAKDLCKKSKDFFDKFGPFGCSYSEIVDVVAALASDMTFKVKK